MSGGHGGNSYMGWWGSMGGPKQKGITTYTVSPYAQRPLAHVAHNAVFNTFRRVKSQVLYVVLPASIVWYFWAQARDYNDFLYTKAGREELEKYN